MSAGDKEPDLSIKPEEYVEIISTEDERIKIIGEELANDTGRAIFAKISQGVASANAIAKDLDISLPLVNWHTTRLLGVGLIRIEKVEMSQKNKQMKFYAPVKTALVIIPPGNPSGTNPKISRRKAVLESLRHYMAAIISFIVVSSGIYIAGRIQVPQQVPYSSQAPASPIHEAIRAAPLYKTASAPEPSLFGSEQTLMTMALIAGAVSCIAVLLGTWFAVRNR